MTHVEAMGLHVGHYTPLLAVYPDPPLLPVGSGHFRAKPFPLRIPQHFSNLVILHLPAYEDGTDRVFRNINSDAGELPRGKHKTTSRALIQRNPLLAAYQIPLVQPLSKHYLPKPSHFCYFLLNLQH